MLGKTKDNFKKRLNVVFKLSNYSNNKIYIKDDLNQSGVLKTAKFGMFINKFHLGNRLKPSSVMILWQNRVLDILVTLHTRWIYFYSK